MAINLATAHRVVVNIPYGELQHTIDLCGKICEAEYRYSSAGLTSPAWEFFFESEKDYVAFLLWKK